MILNAIFRKFVYLVSYVTLLVTLAGCGANDASNNREPSPASTIAVESNSANDSNQISSYASPEEGVVENGYPVSETSAPPTSPSRIGGVTDALLQQTGQLLYHSDETGSFHIYLQSNSNEAINLTRDMSMAVEPMWSPNGQRILFSTTEGQPSQSYIYVMNIDGSDKQRVPVDYARLNWHPVWSPDGQDMVFVSNRDDNFEIYRASLDGSDLTNLSNNQANDFDPDWSPTVNRIVFASSRSGPGNGIYTMDPDGTDIVELLDYEWSAMHPRWSPDGTMIAFMSLVDNTQDIYVMTADGNNIQKVTDITLSNAMPSWLDNDTLFFAHETGDLTWDLYQIDIDGTNMIQLTQHSGKAQSTERYPQWRP